MNDQVFYDQVAVELQDNIIDQGLWTRAYAKGGGIESKAKSLYIELRVEQLTREAEPARRAQEEILEKERTLETARQLEEKRFVENTAAMQTVEEHNNKIFKFDHIMFWLGWILLIGIPYMIYRKISWRYIFLVIGVSLVMVIFTKTTDLVLGTNPNLRDPLQIVWLVIFIAIWYEISKRTNRWSAENTYELKKALVLVGKMAKEPAPQDNYQQAEFIDESLNRLPEQTKNEESDNHWPIHLTVATIAIIIFLAIVF